MTQRFELTPFDKVKINRSTPYLVKGLIPREGLILFWGPPKCGKSFYVFDVAMHIALGWEYRGRRVKQGPVVYVACEGVRGLGARTEAFRQAKMAEAIESVPFFLVTTRLDLIGEYSTLIRDIRDQIGETQPVALVIDTLNRSLNGSETDDMPAYVKAADAVREAFDCAVIVIHHCGVDGSRPRGHTSLTGAADAQLAVKRDASGTITVTVEWLKDGAEGDEVTSRLEVVDVGQDDDGETITSCVIRETDAPAKPRAKLTPRQQRAAEALQNLLADHSKLAPAGPHYPTNGRVIEMDLWRENLFAAGVIDREAANPRQDFKRLKDGLADRDAIREWDGLVWLVSKPASQPEQRKD